MGDPSSGSVGTSTLSAGGLLLLVLLTLGWGINWPIMKIVLTEMPVLSFRAVAAGTGGLGLLLIAVLAGQSLRVPAGQWSRLAAIAFFNITAWNALAVTALAYLPSGRAAVLGFTMPLWSVPLSRWLLGEPVTRRKLLALACGIAGIGLLLGRELVGLQAAPVGALLMLSAAVSWAFGIVLLKRFPVDLPTTALTAWQLLLGALPLLAGALLFDRGDLQPLSLWPALGLVYNMGICFVFCYWAWFTIVGMVPVGISSLSTLAIPAVGVASGMAVLGERPDWPEIAAMALLLIGLAAVLLPGSRPAPKGWRGRPGSAINRLLRS